MFCADPADLHQAPPEWMRPREAMPSRPVVDVIFRTCDGEEPTEMTKLSLGAGLLTRQQRQTVVIAAAQADLQP